MTVVACSLGILKFCAPRWLDPELVFAVIVILLPRLLLYAIPAGLVVVAAHWTVIRSTSSTRRCRWLGIHWLSWLAVAAVGGPFFHYSLIAYTGMVAVELPALAIRIAAGNPALRVVLGYGWPLTYWSVGPLDTYLAPLSLVADAVVWLAATVATGFIVERWVRRVEQRDSMRPSAFLSALFVACVSIWVVSNDHSGPPRLVRLPALAARHCSHGLRRRTVGASPVEPSCQDQSAGGARRGRRVLD